MGSVDNYVTVTISQTPSGVTREGYGTLGFLSFNATFPERSRLYKSATALAVDITNPLAPERLAGAAFFSQQPNAGVFKVLRCANKPTIVYTMSAVTPTGKPSTAYKLRVAGSSFNTVELTYTSDASPTDAEWAAGVVAMLNGVAGKNYTAAGSASPITVTGNTAGAWFSVEIMEPALSLMTSELTHADPGLTADLDAIKISDSDFFMVSGSGMSGAMIASATAWCEANKRFGHFQSSDTKCQSEGAGLGNDPGDDIKTLAYNNSDVLYIPGDENMVAVAQAGLCLSFNPGEETWALKSLRGVRPVTLTDTQRANLVAKNINSYETVAGVNVTFDGRVASGDYIDATRARLWFADEVQKNLFTGLISLPKVPFDFRGQTFIDSRLQASAKLAVERGVLAQDEWSTFVPDPLDVPEADRNDRLWSGTSVEGRMQGAAHDIGVRVVLTV